VGKEDGAREEGLEVERGGVGARVGRLEGSFFVGAAVSVAVGTARGEAVGDRDEPKGP
jgi:hypothetical protein